MLYGVQPQLGFKRRTTAEVRAQMVAAYEAGHTVREIAAAHRVGKECARQVLIAAGVTLRPPKPRRKVDIP